MGISFTSLLVLSHAAKQVDQATEDIRRATAIHVENPEIRDQVDLNAETVKLLAGRTAFEAGAVLAKTTDEMAKQTIDLLG